MEEDSKKTKTNPSWSVNKSRLKYTKKMWWINRSPSFVDLKCPDSLGDVYGLLSCAYTHYVCTCVCVCVPCECLPKLFQFYRIVLCCCCSENEVFKFSVKPTHTLAIEKITMILCHKICSVSFIFPYSKMHMHISL